MKRNGRDEQNGAVIHTCIETTQVISLCTYLFLKLPKLPYFSYYFMFLSSTKLENRRVEYVLPGDGVLALILGRRITIMQIIYRNVCKCKKDTC
jgi:hypothetical protein